MIDDGNRKDNKIWTALFITLIFVSLSDTMTLQALNNVTPLYVDSMNGTATLSGILATVFSISAGVGRLTGGYLADTRGRRKIMMLGLSLLLVGALLPAFIYNVPLLIVARTMQGVGFAITATAAGSAVADILPKERMGEGIGYYALGQSISSATGPAIGIWLASGGNFRMVFSVLCGVAAVGLILSSTCNYEKKAAYRESLKADVGNSGNKELLISRFFEKRAFPAGLMNLCMAMGFAAYLNFIALYGETIHVGNIGTFFTVSAIVMLVCRLTLSRYIDKIHPKLIIIVSMSLGFISFIMVAFLTQMIFFYIAGALYGFCFGIMMPFCNVLAVRDTPTYKRGAATATCYIGADLGMGIGGTLCGILIDHFGFRMMFCISSCWMIITIIVGLCAVKDKR